MLNCAIRNNKPIELFVWADNFTFIKEFNSIKERKREDNVKQLPLLLSTIDSSKIFLQQKTF
jgi:hypothetical protein